MSVWRSGVFLEYLVLPRFYAIVLVVLCLSGCVSGNHNSDAPGAVVSFDPVPPQSVQTESLREIRFRRYVSEDNATSSDWSSEPSIWPLENPEREVISRYGPRGRSGKMHNGIDIKAPKGTTVVATADGSVIYAGRRSGYGNYIELDHGDGVVSAYGHFESLFVNVGDVVRQGEPIGAVGSTGNASTPHVHYEVRIDGETYAPWLFLPAVSP